MLAATFATSAASGVATQWPVSRRGVLFAAVAAPLAPLRSSAAVDCLQDCQSNCFRVAPKSGRYCLDSCAEYCDQPDRRDGLSGSISNDAAEAPLPSDASPHLPPSSRHIVPFQKNQKEGCTMPLRWGAGASCPSHPLRLAGPARTTRSAFCPARARKAWSTARTGPPAVRCCTHTCPRLGLWRARWSRSSAGWRVVCTPPLSVLAYPCTVLRRNLPLCNATELGTHASQASRTAGCAQPGPDPTPRDCRRRHAQRRAGVGRGAWGREVTDD